MSTRQRMSLGRQFNCRPGNYSPLSLSGRGAGGEGGRRSVQMFADLAPMERILFVGAAVEWWDGWWMRRIVRSPSCISRER